MQLCVQLYTHRQNKRPQLHSPLTNHFSASSWHSWTSLGTWYRPYWRGLKTRNIMHTCQAHKHKRRQPFLASSSPVSPHVLSHFKPFLPHILSFNPLIPHLLCLILTPSFLTFSVGDVLQYSRLLLCGCGFSGYAHGGRVIGLLH